jgi:FtsX-like permease family
MGLGAVCGALSSLYTAVDSRTREIATLRAIGFGSAPVVASVLAEALILAIPAALLGAGIAWLLFNGSAVVAGGLTFHMAVTPHLVVVSALGERDRRDRRLITGRQGRCAARCDGIACELSACRDVGSSRSCPRYPLFGLNHRYAPRPAAGLCGTAAATLSDRPKIERRNVPWGDSPCGD